MPDKLSGELSLTSPKKVIVLHPCSFTRLGMKHIFSPVCDIRETEYLYECKEWLLKDEQYDLLILTMNGNGYSAISALKFIDCIVSCNNFITVIVIMNRPDEGVGHYLSHYGDKIAVMAESISLADLVGKVISRIYPAEGGIKGVIIKKPRSPCLSEKEVIILEALLTGHRACDIAELLHVREKTLSYYKRRGLAKLGVRKLGHLLDV